MRPFRASWLAVSTPSPSTPRRQGKPPNPPAPPVCAGGLGGFPWRRGVDGEGVDTASQLARKGRINHAVALDSGLTFERLRHDIDPVMGLPARSGSGVAFVLVRFVQHFAALGLESLGQLLCAEIGGPHTAR